MSSIHTTLLPPLIHIQQPSATTTTTTPFVLALALALALLLPTATYLIHRDYRAFLSLGAGGTPQTFLSGYLRVKLLSVFALSSPRSPAPVPADLRQTGYLVGSSLPARRGPRPTVVGIAPHRQTTQRAGAMDGAASAEGASAYAMLAARLRALARDPANHLAEGTSCFEKHGTGLFSTRPLTRTCRGEVCHVHGSDGSLHMTLYPGDAKLVIERGWGERHPIARGGFFSRFVPRHFVMVYAPRDEGEVAVVARIVGAAVWWVSGVCVGKGEGEEEGGGVRDDRARSEADALVVEEVREAGGEVDWRSGKGVSEAMFCSGCRQKQYARMQACS
ncbi:uncharacterized protein BKCO1_4000211 [Diplodia corticola]|uniref:Luciferase domain-containing protein n=1 Tax=Diplodia corticola TaxID=236234 RepID=A0A1J9REH1_9PEZI|nr:uncharacterized protein BKCO1_4000211 [Diplodia corticola]OJD38809.1 hypothetical protein BKCO1_4000211 [Diplodia corticola]